MAEVSRRAVLLAGAGTASVLAIGVEAPDAEAAATSQPARSHYARSVGKKFTITRAGHTHEVRLLRIANTIGHTAPSQHEKNFLLVFSILGGAHLADGIYAVRRAGVRTHSLFMSGMGPRRLQVVVNRSA